MVLWTKLMALSGKLLNFDLLRKKTIGKLPKTVKLLFIKKKNHNGNIPKQFKFLNKYIA